MLRTYRHIASHPLTSDHRAAAMLRWLRWQLGSRLLGQSVAVPFVNDARLLVAAGMTGATGNIYCGLHEFEHMGFLLHFLRPGDLFLDVGANIGSYTVLASAVCGADAVAIEPDAEAGRVLKDNVSLNGIEARVRICALALGRVAGTVRFSCALDTGNHVLSPRELQLGEKFVEVGVQTAEEVLKGRVPALVKMDIEGFELEVVEGSASLFADPALQAVVVELNGSGLRYGHSDEALHQALAARGYAAWRYTPLTRELHALGSARPTAGNVLYLRDPNVTGQRLSSAPSFRVLGREI